MSSEGFSRLNHGAQTDSIIDNVVQVTKEEGHEPAEDKILEKLSSRKAMLAGILTAVNESTLDDFYSSKT